MLHLVSNLALLCCVAAAGLEDLHLGAVTIRLLIGIIVQGFITGAVNGRVAACAVCAGISCLLLFLPEHNRLGSADLIVIFTLYGAAGPIILPFYLLSLLGLLVCHIIQAGRRQVLPYLPILFCTILPVFL